ncbi:alpha-glucan family phosphorylase [Olivibacter sitiensis]|uniref:alpha-glucan family phosphorylase n=1 Tax=Olivibacter sitiensis TaxID=376470 RepID=UPI00041F594A|nr:alpha-glucan family phosphorylase [Olivibacter sitiensis]
MESTEYTHPYPCNEEYSKRVAYFSMEFAIDQALKIYSGGLGFLAGSHLRSAYSLRQHMVGIGILWKYGYYDQGRNEDQTLRVDWQEKIYSFLEDTGIKFTVKVHGADVWVKVYYLHPNTFQSAPLYLLTTDTEENDYVSKTISHRLYDPNEATKLAQYILLGIGGAKLLDILHYNCEVYHLNEAHALPAAFYLLRKFGSPEALREHLVFTTHTPEEAGNEKHNVQLCEVMSYFYDFSANEIQQITQMHDDSFNLSLAALRLAKKANGVSQLHAKVARLMWEKYGNTCPIEGITNAQNWAYWADKKLYELREHGDDEGMRLRKQKIKRHAFLTVADQAGEIYRPDVLTVVWARRFAAYKRADLLLRHRERFEQLVKNTKYPIQIIWAGKPYPTDMGAVNLFNYLVHMSKVYPNISVLTGYELALSRQLKQCADIWLNNPRVPREASGTSGMTAAMNGALNLSTNDGWIPEFIKHEVNGFVIPTADYEHTSIEEQDEHDFNHLYDLLENTILPMYYDDHAKWLSIVKQSMDDVRYTFGSDRMAREYYERLYK